MRKVEKHYKSQCDSLTISNNTQEARKYAPVNPRKRAAEHMQALAAQNKDARHLRAQPRTSTNVATKGLPEQCPVVHVLNKAAMAKD